MSAQPSEFLHGKRLSIMIVEDNHFDRENLIRFLTNEGITADYTHVVHRKDFKKHLSSAIDLIICDHKLPDFDSFIAYDLLEHSGLDIPFIIVSGAISEDRAVQVLKRGAADFLPKHSLSRLTSSIREALQNKQLKLENNKSASELKAAQESLQLAIDSTELGTWDYSTQKKRLSLSRRGRELHGLPETEGISPSFFLNSIDKRDRRSLAQKIRTLIRSGEEATFRVNYRLKCAFPEEHPTWVSIRGKAYVDSKNRFERLSGVLMDISETKWLEEQLRSSVLFAEKANSAKSMFLANMSHEIRTPLGAMIGFAEILEKECVEAESQVFAGSVIRNGKKLLRIVDEILDLSKIEKGKLELEFREFSLLEIINDLKENFLPSVQAKGIEFQIDASELNCGKIFSDEGRLAQILTNLVGNAIKFTDKGSVTLRIFDRRVEKDFAEISFEIIDTGIGISPEQAKKLFSPFQQADLSTTRRYGGTGLGLVLARKLCEALGGSLVLQSSQLEKGSLFLATIKAKRASEKENHTLIDSSRLKVKRLEGVSILLVDDAVDNQFLVARAISREGARVVLADNGQIGLQAAESSHFDIILMDMQMPVMDGLTATRSLRRLGNNTPIIALTAHAMLEERMAALQAGCQAHISKPINFEILISSIENLVHPQTEPNDLVH
ncbi:MAG: response regulator [Proteobacteria bacterium]|nr:MAG: response regulator [Pseudomonadota bacterium]